MLFGLSLLPALAQGQPWEGFDPDAEYVIRFASADRCLDTGDPKGTSDHPQVHMHTCWESPVQRWRVDAVRTYRVPNGLKPLLLRKDAFTAFALRSVMDGRCIGFRSGDVREHAGATLGTCNGADDQSWIALDFGAAAEGGRKIRFVSLKQLQKMPGVPGLCLHIHHPSLVAQLRHCQKGASQDLRVVERSRADPPDQIRLTLDRIRAVNQQEEGSGQDEVYFVSVGRGSVHHTRELSLGDGQALSRVDLPLWEGRRSQTDGTGTQADRIEIGLYESDGGRANVLDCAEKQGSLCTDPDDELIGAFELEFERDRGIGRIRSLELEDADARTMISFWPLESRILKINMDAGEDGASVPDVAWFTSTATYELGVKLAYRGVPLPWKGDGGYWYAFETGGRSSTQRLGYDRPVNEGVARTPEPAATPPLTSEELVGRYQRDPVENDWHVGTIEPAPGGKLRWRNQAGASWELTPDLASRKLHTSRENPYYDDGARAFDIATDAGGVTGFVFMGETYRRTGDAPTRTATPAPQPPPQVATAALTPESLVGTYRREPVENDWHVGRIQAVGDGTLRWTNDARASWGLRPDLANQKLHTDQQNPYYAGGAREFEIVVEAGRVTGFRFQGELYRRVPGSDQSRPAAEAIPWASAEEILRTGPVHMIAQSHSGDLSITLKDGTRYRTTQPEVDAAWHVLEEAGRADEVLIVTE